MLKSTYKGHKTCPGVYHPHIRKKGMTGSRHAELRKLIAGEIKKGTDVDECVLAIRTLGEVIEKSSTPLILKKVRGIKDRGLCRVRLVKGCKAASGKSEGKRALKGWK